MDFRALALESDHALVGAAACQFADFLLIDLDGDAAVFALDNTFVPDVKFSRLNFFRELIVSSGFSAREKGILRPNGKPTQKAFKWTWPSW